MKTEVLYDLQDMLCHELSEIAGKGKLSIEGVDIVEKMTHSLKHIASVLAMEEGYSGDGSYAEERRNPGESYRGYSSRRGRNRMTGRYMSRVGYSGDGLKDELERLMDQAGSEQEREAIRRCMEQMH
jgi:hypothetical protein